MKSPVKKCIAIGSGLLLLLALVPAYAKQKVSTRQGKRTYDQSCVECHGTGKDGAPRLVVGFAAETEKVIEHAQAKLARKGCDLIVANDVSAKGNVFGSDANTVHLVSAKGVESWPRLSKDEVATRLMTALAERL